jgi:hypothetical protein
MLCGEQIVKRSERKVKVAKLRGGRKKKFQDHIKRVNR